jgi:beta-glucosidase
LRLSAATISPTETLRVSATLTNTGAREGTEIAQLYVRVDVGSVTRPVRQLAGFRRVSLKPGEARTIAFALGPKELGFYGKDMRFRVEPGRVQVFVGTSSVEGIEGAFRVR